MTQRQADVLGGSVMPALVAVELHTLRYLLGLDDVQFRHHRVEPVIDTVEVSLVEVEVAVPRSKPAMW